MNFNRSGWFSSYINFRTDTPLPRVLPSFGVRVVENTSIHNDLEQAIYYFLQPTGLLYGSPIIGPFPDLELPGSDHPDSTSRTHVVFMESLFACLVADRHFLLDELVEEGDRFIPAVGVALSYFMGDSALIDRVTMGEGEATQAPESRTLKRFEKAVRQRLSTRRFFGFRPPQFYNSFVFLDLYSCLLWQRRILTEMEISQEALDGLWRQQLGWRESLIRLLIVASQSDNVMQPRERQLIRHFLKSSELPESTRGELRRLMKSKLDISDVEVGEMPWLVRRYCLELILMTVMADRVVTEEEHAFVVVISERLGLWQEEVNQSLVVLELFMIHHREKLDFLKESPDTFSLRERFLERAAYLVRSNLDRLVNEIRETRELYTLLMKATKSPLTKEEKLKVREQITDILKTIPALAVLALPGGGIILPVLIKLLPFNLLPSSFED